MGGLAGLTFSPSDDLPSRAEQENLGHPRQATRPGGERGRWLSTARPA